MHRSARLRGSGLAVAVAAATILLPTTAGAVVPDEPMPTATLPEDVAVERVSGASRIETAVEVSKATFETADFAVLGRSDDPADALTGAPLAAALGGPLLLTPTDDVPQVVLDELERLGVTTVYVLGGAAAVSEAAEATLLDAGLSVERLAGATRFETAVEVTDELVGDDEAGTVFVVNGFTWPDAMSVGAYAGFIGAPILPINADSVPEVIEFRLSGLSPEDIVIIGGTGVVSDDVLPQLQFPGDALVPDDPGFDVSRIAGANRYETSAAVYDTAVQNGLSPVAKWLGVGTTFADSLAMGAAAGATGQSMLIVPPDVVSNQAVADRILASWDLLELVRIVGGTGAITAEGESELATRLVPAAVAGDLCLTVLHNNDGESQLIDAGSGLSDFGGAARFATRMFTEVARANLERDNCAEVGVLRVTSGDNFLAGPEFTASVENSEANDVPFFDTLLLDYLNYDAIDLGNHDFDFGPGVTAQLIDGMEDDDQAVFLSANLDFSNNADLQAQIAAGKLAPSTTVEIGGHTVGVIGITPPTLPVISSPGDVIVLGADPEDAGAVDFDTVAQIINDEAATLTADDGADIIVLISHLQGLDEDIQLTPMLDGVDIVVAGGGDEVLATPGELLVPGDEIETSYPTYAEGSSVPIVTTSGNFKYVGRLVTIFDEAGELVGVDDRLSRMVRVAGAGYPDAVADDPYVAANIVAPVEDYLSELATTVIGTSQVDLDGLRSHIRTQETNIGNLVADSYRQTAIDKAADFGLDDTATFVGLTNGGGIRNDSVIEAGDVTLLDTFDISPFGNFVSVFEDVTVDQLDGILEHAYADFGGNGAFAQLSNLLVDVDRGAAEGERVSNIRTADGAALTDGFSLVLPAFTANGGDDYPFEALGFGPFTPVGVTDQQAVAAYIEGTLGGTITDGGYPLPGGYPEILDPPTNAERIVFTDL